MKANLIGLGLAVTIFTGSFFTSTPVLADSFFKDAMKLGGEIYKKTGEAMEALGEKQKDSPLGKGLKIGGKVHKAVGKTLEKTADDLDKKEAR
jgi:hypothetical protein